MTWAAPSISLAVVLALAPLAHADQSVRVVRVPNGGIQPQVAVDAAGTAYLLYFKGDAAAGDLWLARMAKDEKAFSAGMRVNTRDGSAIAVGNIRGAHLSLGRAGRVHVAWMGSKQAEPKALGKHAPMLYARTNDAGTAFEPERNLIQAAYGLDGGGTVAAAPDGTVYVAWHAGAGASDEAARAVWIARSTDDGKTFAREQAAWAQPTGACGCCGMRALVDPTGAVFVLYRSATDQVNRDMYLLASKGKGKAFGGALIDRWSAKTCVMSTAALSADAETVVAAWETQGQIRAARWDAKKGKLGAPFAAPGAGGDRKHPAIALGSQRHVLLAWTEGMGWERGGRAAWQVYGASNEPVGEVGGADGVPVWSLVAAFAVPGGGFVVVY